MQHTNGIKKMSLKSKKYSEKDITFLNKMY